MNDGTVRERATVRRIDERAAAREQQRLQRREQARKRGSQLEGKASPLEVVANPTAPVPGVHRPGDLRAAAPGRSSVFRALSSHGQVRQAFLVMEILRSPISMRDQEADQH